MTIPTAGTTSRRRRLIGTAIAVAVLSAGCSTTSINQQGGTNVNCGGTSNCANDYGDRDAAQDGGRRSPSASDPAAPPSPSDPDDTATPRPRSSSPRPLGSPSSSVGGKKATDLAAYPTATVYANGAPLLRVVWVETPENKVQFSGVGRTQIRARRVEGVGYHMRLASTSTFRLTRSDGSLDYAFVGPDSRLLQVRNPGSCSSNCAALNPTREGSALAYTTVLQVHSGRLASVPAGAVMTYRLE
ncbi:hypothetical protein [Streptomyces antimicrobicus]|uniref:Lipoprotein n=1 Tax=Streptomyces antimicrobicus TaxID=2883108 RepID=A0ABS8BB25_9ACTN|nr:hypothetical protein [Streptomyces antimicrobicus]MCB5181835.1 hypothetical protein [Streptomyces antimicrobicus]